MEQDPVINGIILTFMIVSVGFLLLAPGRSRGRLKSKTHCYLLGGFIAVAGTASILINMNRVDPAREVERIISEEKLWAYAKGKGLGSFMNKRFGQKKVLILTSGLPSDRGFDDEIMKGLREACVTSAIIGPVQPPGLNAEELAGYPKPDQVPNVFRDIPGNSYIAYQKAVDANPGFDLIVFLHDLPWQGETMDCLQDKKDGQVVIVMAPSESAPIKELLESGVIDAILVNKNLGPDQWNQVPSTDATDNFQKRFRIKSVNVDEP